MITGEADIAEDQSKAGSGAEAIDPTELGRKLHDSQLRRAVAAQEAFSRGEQWILFKEGYPTLQEDEALEALRLLNNMRQAHQGVVNPEIVNVTDPDQLRALLDSDLNPDSYSGSQAQILADLKLSFQYYSRAKGT